MHDSSIVWLAFEENIDPQWNTSRIFSLMTPRWLCIGGYKNEDVFVINSQVVQFMSIYGPSLFALANIAIRSWMRKAMDNFKEVFFYNFCYLPIYYL